MGAYRELAILTLPLKTDICLYIFTFFSITHTTNFLQPHYTQPSNKTITGVPHSSQSIHESQCVRPSRWQSKTRRSTPSPQIHQKYIYMWNSSCRTPTERWQKTSKGKKIPTYLGRAKEKRKNRDKRIGMGSAPREGSCKGGKVSTY